MFAHAVLVGVLMQTAASESEGKVAPLRLPDQIEAKGESYARLKLAYDRLCSPPLDDPEFVLSDVNFRFVRRFTEYSGDVSGRMLGALNAAAAVLSIKPPMLDDLIAGFAKYQKPDGHFGADQDLAKTVNQNRDMPICWGNGRLLLALAERYRTAPSPELMTLARKLGDYVISTRKYYGKEENFKSVGGIAASGYTTCYPSMIDGLAALAQVSGDSRYMDEAKFIAKLSLIDKEFAHHHSHGRLTAYRGMLDIDRFTGSREFVDTVGAGCRRVIDEFILPTGGITEYFSRDCTTDEGCSESDWLRVSFFMWEATGDPMYLDVAEHVLRNHLYGAQFRQGGFGHWGWSPAKLGSTAYDYAVLGHKGSDAYWCCSMHGTQVLADAVRWGIVARGGKILITWLSEARATLKPTDSSPAMTITTERPSLNAWTVTVEAPAEVQATLALRVPGWTERIEVDGRPCETRSGWAEVNRKWSGMSQLRVTLPDAIRLAGPYRPQVEEGKPVRVFSGADLYILPEVQIPQGYVKSDAIPRLVLSADRPTEGRIPVLIEGADSKLQKAALVPMSRRPLGGARLLFAVRRIDGEAFRELASKAAEPPAAGTPVVFKFACDGECKLFLNGKDVGHYAGWHDAAETDAYTHTASNVLTIRAHSNAAKPGLIGIILAGGKMLVTRPDDWSVAAVPDNMPAGATGEPEGSSKPIDIGPLGTPPWGHMSGGLVKTGARWIWAEKPAPAKGQIWQFRCAFEMPEVKP